MESEHKISLDAIHSRISSREKLHELLSQEYVLPTVNSHACTLQYLLKYSQNPIPIYTCPIEGTKIFKRRRKNKNCMEMLADFEKLLEKKNLPPTGMNPTKLPDVDWLCTVIHREDPDDSLKLFCKLDETVTVTRSVNEKYITSIMTLIHSF